MNARPRKFGNAMKAGLCALALTAAGCQSAAQTHAQVIKGFDTKWHSVRSTSMLGVAQQQFDTGDLAQAEQTLLNALSEDPTNPFLHVLAGRIALERGELERAFDRFKTALSFKKDCPDAFYYQGVVYQRWQQYQEAYDCYKHAYEIVADNPGPLMAMSEMLVSMDRRPEARELLESKLTYFDQNAGLRAALGELYAVDRKYDEAIRYLQQAVQLRPDDLQTVESLASVELAGGKTAEAVQNFERLCHEPTLANRRDLKMALALAYEQTGRRPEARRIYQGLTHADPNDDQAWLRLGGLAMAENELEGALEAGERVMKLAPQKPDGYLMAGMVWQKRGLYERAIPYFERASALAPKNAEPVILRGIALEASGQTGAAATAYAEALKRSPDDRRAQELLARLTREAPAHD